MEKLVEWNGFWQGKPKCSEKTCRDATFSTTNPTCQTGARTRATTCEVRSRTLYPEMKRLGLQRTWSYTSILSYVFIVWCLTKRRDNFIFLHMPTDHPTTYDNIPNPFQRNMLSIIIFGVRVSSRLPHPHLTHFDPEEGGTIFHRNLGIRLQDYAVW
jgi:hypothetical protein